MSAPRYEITFGVMSWEHLVATDHGDRLLRAIQEAIRSQGKDTFMVEVKALGDA